MPYASAVIPKKQRGNAFTRFLNSGIGVAMICGIVAIGVTLGVLMMGWNDDPVSPVGNAVTSTAPETSATATSFAFSYAIAPVKDDYEPGETLTVTTEVENLGESFTVKGSSQAFHAAAWLIPHGSTDIHNAEGKINGNFAIREDYVIQTIETGDIGHHRGSILLPETASGSYDLVLSYGDEYQVFENAVKYIHKVIDPRLPLIIISLALFLLDVAVRKFKWKWPHELIHEKKLRKEIMEKQERKERSGR